MLSELDHKILKCLQEGIPLVAAPFESLAESLEICETELLAHIKRLKDERMIRIIAPIYDTKKLEFDSALVALKVAPEDVERMVEIINSHPGVSHNYGRAHRYNIWFTLVVPPGQGYDLE